MKFKIKDLKKLLSSTVKNKIEYIDIKSSNLQITINRIKNIPYIVHETQGNSRINQIIKKNKIEPIKTKINLETPELENETNIYFTILSPMIGTFYRSPAPNEPTFINTHDIVKINQTVCIIEAMKLMNEIQAEVEGEIVEILVDDGDIVDCGQALMRVKHKK